MANPLGFAVVALTVTFASPSLAETARAGEPTLDPVLELMPSGSFGGSFETACLESVQALSVAAEATQAKDEKTAPPQENATKPTLQDLGFPPDLTQANAEAQARLDKRSHMLKIHQRLGLITLVPLLATVLTSNGATRNGSTSARNLHAALGLVTAGLYITSASFAIRAPSIPGIPVRGPIRLHKALAWVHGAGMILTPILGAMARAQLDRGEKVHGIASAHSAVADVTIAAYAAAIGTVAIKF